MCECDEDIGRRFLSHQLEYGTELESQRRVKVTLGFQPKICRECKNLEPIAHPKAEIYGMTSKIRRYYWREIFMETSRRFADWASSEGYSDLQLARREHPKKYEELESETVEHIKKLHQDDPKYKYEEKSQSQVMSENSVDVIDLKGVYAHAEDGSLVLVRDGELLSPEQFAVSYLKEEEYSTVFSESIPFHVLFGVFMWLLIQDPDDTELQLRSFGRRDPNESEGPQVINVFLPPDFGAPGYFVRRKQAIEKHLEELPRDREHLYWLFDYWLPHSEDLRQYLWAHEPEKIQVARKLLEILSPEEIVKILEYMVADYWRRFVGWPDLLAFNDEEHMFVEVKSSKDRLSENQTRWIEDNSAYLQFRLKLVKIHKLPT